MNRVRIGLLVATAAIAGLPVAAIAQAAPNNDGQHHAQGDRGQRGAPPPVQDRRSMPAPAQGARPAQPQQQQQGQQQPQAQGQRPATPQNGFGQNGQGHRPNEGGQGDRHGAPGQAQPPRAGLAPQADPNRAYPGGDRRPNSPAPGNGWRGNDPRPGGGQNFRGDDHRDPRMGYGNPNNRAGWRNDWRSDRRYDWQGWRDRNRGQFRAPRYMPPRGYGWGYRPFSIGSRLDPFFYGEGYWLDDPWDYRLPPVYGPYRWVRYYDDVLLVDIDSGEVIDVIHNFFWE